MELFVVTDNIMQNEYTEPRYGEQAIDATCIIGIYSTREQAIKEVERLENQIDDSGDSDIKDQHYYSVQTFNYVHKMPERRRLRRNGLYNHK